MICKNCGASIVAGLTECEFCGTLIYTSGLKAESATAQSFVSLLSFEEKQRLSFLMRLTRLAKNVTIAAMNGNKH